MLSSEQSPRHEGLRLMGSAEVLREFHSLVHDVKPRSVLIRHKDGFFLAFAYDIRKAYEGQRTKGRPNPDVPHAGPTLGVEILWPTLLVQVQVRVLRASLGFFDSTKRHQPTPTPWRPSLKRDSNAILFAITTRFMSST